MEETPFFRLIEERSPEEIAEEMKYAFGPSKGRMNLTISGGIFFDDETISSEVLEAMDRMMVEMQDNICFPRHLVEIKNTSPNRLYISKPNPLTPFP